MYHNLLVIRNQLATLGKLEAETYKQVLVIFL